MSDALYDEASEAKTSDSKSTAKKTKEDSAGVIGGVLPIEETVLDRLKAVVSAKVERTVVLLEVPDRPGVHLRISPNITQAQMKAWRKNAGEESKNGLDPIKFACQVVGQTCVGISMDGEEAFDEAGNALNFAAPEILEMTSATRPVPDAVRNFFGTDPHVEGAALAVLEAAGYGDTVDVLEDPTN
jgi:hypothetical protein